MQKIAFLSETENNIFESMLSGESNKVMAKKFDKSDSHIRKIKSTIRKKIDKELRRTANSLRLDIEKSKINKDVGLLCGFDWVHNTPVYLVLTNEGIIAWWEHECSFRCQETCKQTLDLVCANYRITLSDDEKNQPFLEQFRLVVSRIQEVGANRNE